MKEPRLALMLNSCDKYADLWPIFLDQIYEKLPVDDLTIYVNSESKDWADPRFHIVNVHPPKLTSFTGRLKHCVSQVREPFVLSMPEECILERQVDAAAIETAVRILEEGDVASVCLVHIPGNKYAAKPEYAPFIERKYEYRYMISQQAAIWNTRKLEQYIRPGQNPWEYEIYSSARGPIGSDRFFSVLDDQEEVAKYNYGYLVYRGHWCKEEIDRLQRNCGITFDMTARECLPMETLRKHYAEKVDWYWFKVRIVKWTILILKAVGIRI